MLSFNDNLRVRYESNSRFMGIFSWVISNAIGFAILRRLSTSEIGGWYFSFSLSVCISSTPAAALLSKYGSSSTFGISLRRLSNGFGSATVVLIAGMSSHVDRSARILMLGPEIFFPHLSVTMHILHPGWAISFVADPGVMSSSVSL